MIKSNDAQRIILNFKWKWWIKQNEMFFKEQKRFKWISNKLTSQTLGSVLLMSSMALDILAWKKLGILMILLRKAMIAFSRPSSCRKSYGDLFMNVGAMPAPVCLLYCISSSSAHS